MTRHHPIQNPRPNRDDVLPNIVYGHELNDELWDTDVLNTTNRTSPHGAFGVALEHKLGENHPAIDTITLLVEKLAQSLRDRAYRINDVTYPLIVGHTPLLNAVSIETRELAEHLDLIKRPACYGTDKRIAPRAQIARTSYWDLGPTAKHFLDMQEVRRLGPGYEYQSSDRNEGIAHAVGVELERTRLNAQPGVRAEAFIRLPNHVRDDDYAGSIYDVVGFRQSDNTVVETVEVELQTDNGAHVATDAAKLANAPGQSIWSTPNKASHNQLLRTMSREGLLRPQDDDSGFSHGLATDTATENLRALIVDGKYRSLGEDLPVTEVRTFNGTRRQVQETAPDALSAQAAERRGNGR